MILTNTYTIFYTFQCCHYKLVYGIVDCRTVVSIFCGLLVTASRLCMYTHSICNNISS